MATEGCNKHDDEGGRSLIRTACGGLLAFNFFLLLTILIVYAILHPHKPRFILQDVTVYAFNASIPNILTSSFHVTISSHNPNRRIRIYYDRLDLYLTYRNQQITLPTSLPTSYQGHKETGVWSPFVGGTEVPVAPFNSVALGQDAAIGNLSVVVKIDGRVRWKVGTFASGKYHLFVKCPAYLALKGAARRGFYNNAWSSAASPCKHKDRLSECVSILIMMRNVKELSCPNETCKNVK